MKNNYFGVMLDMSRTGVMKVEEVKKYALLIKKMGYNMLQLYMEDVYEVDNEPYFGYLRGRYSKAELKEIVSYCESIGIETVPCIQTLAHLENLVRWAPYKNSVDFDNILLVGDERVYQLIDNMFKSLRECFNTEFIHIGMDEACMLGLGRYLELHGYQNRVGILSKHLQRVMELCKKYNFKPMMWSDMFFRLANNGQYYPQEPTLTQEVIDIIPKDLGLVYWDYYTTDKEYFKKMMKAHQLAGDNVWFAGGAWTWGGFASGNKFALETMIPAMEAAKECNFKNIMFTLWGDNGKECSYYCVLPTLFTMRKIYEGVNDMDLIKKEFKEIVGEDYDHMMDFDILNYVGGNKTILGSVCKQALYSDPFLGYMDTTFRDGVSKEYEEHAKTLLDHAKNSEYAYLYEMYSAMCDLLSHKYDLGRKTREFYKAKDKKNLKEFTKEYDVVLKKLQVFLEKFRTVWFKECKPNGFETHETRIGGLKERLISCKARLLEYIDGKIKSISELDEDLLDFYGNGKDFKQDPPYHSVWQMIALVSKV